MPASIVLLLLSLSGVVTAIIYLYGLRLPEGKHTGRVTLILPLTGDCSFLSALIGRLQAQSLQPHKLIVVVESTDDPAYRFAQEVSLDTSFPIKITVAGHATQCSQKCWNQIAALEELDGQEEAIVLLDGDIDPPIWWLSVLVMPLLKGKADVVTGYRWHQVTRIALGQHLIASIDRGIAMLPSLHSLHLAWGGSLAMSSSALIALDLPRILSNVLSDDCTIGQQSAVLGLRLLSRRLIRVPTPPHKNITSAWCFGRRQYQIIRIYRPRLWFFALSMLSMRLLVWGIVLANLKSSFVAVFVLLFASGLSMVTVVLQQVAARRLGQHDSLLMHVTQLICTFFKPLIDLFHWTLVIAGGRAGILYWGNTRYHIDSPSRIQANTNNRK